MSFSRARASASRATGFRAYRAGFRSTSATASRTTGAAGGASFEPPARAATIVEGTWLGVGAFDHLPANGRLREQLFEQGAHHVDRGFIDRGIGRSWWRRIEVSAGVNVASVRDP